MFPPFAGKVISTFSLVTSVETLIEMFAWPEVTGTLASLTVMV